MYAPPYAPNGPQVTPVVRFQFDAFIDDAIDHRLAFRIMTARFWADCILSPVPEEHKRAPYGRRLKQLTIRDKGSHLRWTHLGALAQSPRERDRELGQRVRGRR